MNINLEMLDPWILTRAAGISAYVLLSLAVMSGLYLQICKQRRVSPGFVVYFHQPLANWGLYLALFHALILLYDQYVPFRWYEILVPFVSSYQPLWVGIGVVALYGLFLFIMTSEGRAVLGLKVWKRIHVFAPVAYVCATVHGIYLGTDGGKEWMFALYFVSALLVMSLLLFRFTSALSAVVANKR